MTPTQALSMLDRQLAAHGQTITLRRVGSPNVDVSVLAKVSASASAIVAGDLEAITRQVILSPSGLGTWPGALAQSDGTDVQVPRKNDVVIIAGRAHQVVEHGRGIYIGDTLVRIELMVQG